MLVPLSLILFLVLVVLFPFVFSELMLTSLGKLHLSPSAALVLLISIFADGLVNIPIKSIVRSRDAIVHPLAVYGLASFWPTLRRLRQETIIAVNLGAVCLIPTALAILELAYLALLSPRTVTAAAIDCVVNILVCYLAARLVASVGIAMPSVISPLIAAGLALLLAPKTAAPVAFISGVVGPLVGADLLHLKDIEDEAVRIVSIGGAGTFDGIILSGIIAAYLA